MAVDLRDKVKEAVQEHLTLELDELEGLVDYLLSLGIEEVDQLRLVKEEDLTPGLNTMQARTLMEGWASKYGKTQSEQTHRNSTRRHMRNPIQRRVDDEPREWDFEIDWNDVFKIDPCLRRCLEKGKKLKKRWRTSLIERVVSQVRNQVPQCERKTFIQVMRDMKMKYAKSFKHELANGVIGKNSYLASMQAKFDNDKRAESRKSAIEIEAPKLKESYGCVRWRVVTLPDDETPDSLESKRDELINIFRTIRPSAWNHEQIKELMSQTYPIQRKDINTQAENLAKLQKEEARRKRANRNKNKNQNQQTTSPTRSVALEPVITTIMLQEKWPFLFTPDGMMSHFRELTQVNFDELLDTFLQGEAQKVMEFFTAKKPGMHKINKKLKKSLQRAERNQTDSNSPTITAFLMMLTKYVEEDLSFLIRLVEKATDEEDVRNDTLVPKTPLIIVAGDSLFKPEKIFFSMDGFVHGMADTTFEAVKLLFTSYYVFNLNYAPQAQVSLEFIQRCVALINPARGNKRPVKAVTEAAQQRYSAKQIHSSLSKLTNQYEAFFADDLKETDTSSNPDSPDSD